MYVLSEQQGLLLKALQPLEEGESEEKVSHQAGDCWLIRGPLEYVPSAKVEVVEERQAIPLDQNEGIYVQDVKTGKVPAAGWVVAVVASSRQAGDVNRKRQVGKRLIQQQPRWPAGRCEAISYSICRLCPKYLILHIRDSSGENELGFRTGLLPCCRWGPSIKISVDFCCFT